MDVHQTSGLLLELPTGIFTFPLALVYSPIMYSDEQHKSNRTKYKHSQCDEVAQILEGPVIDAWQLVVVQEEVLQACQLPEGVGVDGLQLVVGQVPETQDRKCRVSGDTSVDQMVFSWTGQIPEMQTEDTVLPVQYSSFDFSTWQECLTYFSCEQHKANSVTVLLFHAKLCQMLWMKTAYVTCSAHVLWLQPGEISRKRCREGEGKKPTHKRGSCV